MTTLTLALALAAGADAKMVCYVSESGGDRILAFPVDAATGKLGEPAAVTVGANPGSLALSPDGRLLYAALRGGKGEVATLRIDPATGALSPVKTTKVVENPVYVSVDRTGKCLLTAYYGANKVAAFRIGTDGVPAGEPSQVLDTGLNPHCILPSPDGKNVFVPNTGSDRVLQLRLDPVAGKLAYNEPAVVVVPNRTGPRHLKLHPTRPLAAAVNETASSLTTFRYDPAAGTLTVIDTLSTLPEGFTAGNSCADVEWTPDGKFVYGSNRGHDSLAGFAVDPESGKLTSLGQTKTEKTPREFAIDPTGRFVYAAGQGSGKLAAYAVGADGKLSPLAVYDAGKAPAWVHVHRLGGK